MLLVREITKSTLYRAAFDLYDGQSGTWVGERGTLPQFEIEGFTLPGKDLIPGGEEPGT
ncbi:hypothetical protein [Streptomyces eurythermus]